MRSPRRWRIGLLSASREISYEYENECVSPGHHDRDSGECRSRRYSSSSSSSKDDDSSIPKNPITKRKTKREEDRRSFLDLWRPVSFVRRFFVFSVSVHLVSVDARPLAEAVDACFDLVPDKHEAPVDPLMF